MHKTVAIVVTFNRKDMLQECIHRLLEQTEACDILIIDNASTDGTYDAISQFIGGERIRYYNTDKNIGGAGGFNYGLRKAYEIGYQYFWLMDDDTYPEKDALSKLLKADAQLNHEYGFLSSMAYWKDGSPCNMNIQRTSLNKKITGTEKDNTKIIMATFVSFFLKRETVEQYGLPISEFFIWSDDLEYSRRISVNQPGYFVPQSRVLHAMSSNEKVGIEKDGKERLWRYVYLYRNEVYVFRREGINGWIYLVCRLILHSVRVLSHKGSDKKEKLRLIWKSFFHGIKFHPEIDFV
ncbi:MAG: glycosyltransferase [Clostridiales bacterium]|nr:glycosyltransferase [Clostridiales bacterium]